MRRVPAWRAGTHGAARTHARARPRTAAARRSGWARRTADCSPAVVVAPCAVRCGVWCAEGTPGPGPGTRAAPVTYVRRRASYPAPQDAVSRLVRAHTAGTCLRRGHSTALLSTQVRTQPESVGRHAPGQASGSGSARAGGLDHGSSASIAPQPRRVSCMPTPTLDRRGKNAVGGRGADVYLLVLWIRVFWSCHKLGTRCWHVNEKRGPCFHSGSRLSCPLLLTCPQSGVRG